MVVVTFKMAFMTLTFISFVNCSFLKIVDSKLDTEKASSSLLSLKYDQGGLCLTVSTECNGLLPPVVKVAHSIVV